MGKILEVITSEELGKRGQIQDWELRMPQFKDKTILRFSSLKEAYVFGAHFVHEYLVPKYGKEETARFPMAKSGPSGDGTEVMAEVLGLKEPNLNQETWLVVPTDRFHEVEEYLRQYESKEK